MLSPRDSQITSKPDAGADDSVPDDALELKWEFDEDSRRYYVSFPDDHSGAQLGRSGPCRLLGLIFYFGTIVRP